MRRCLCGGVPPECVVIEGGLTEDHVHDAVRIVATVNAAAVALEVPEGVRA